LEGQRSERERRRGGCGREMGLPTGINVGGLASGLIERDWVRD